MGTTANLWVQNAFMWPQILQFLFGKKDKKILICSQKNSNLGLQIYFLSHKMQIRW